MKKDIKYEQPTFLACDTIKKANAIPLKEIGRIKFPKNLLNLPKNGAAIIDDKPNEARIEAAVEGVIRPVSSPSNAILIVIIKNIAKTAINNNASKIICVLIESFSLVLD